MAPHAEADRRARRRLRRAQGRPPPCDGYAWSLIARTYLFDRYVTRLVEHGVDLVVNLAAGLDTRPYRMKLPASLRWVEVDLPEILDYKESILAGAKPVCEIERVRLDLSNADARRGLFDRLGRGSQRAAILSEGLLIYLMPQEVGALAEDLTRPSSFQHWVVDLVSPSLLEMMTQMTGGATQIAGAPFLFAPAEGPPFFTPHGWVPADIAVWQAFAARSNSARLICERPALCRQTKRTVLIEMWIQAARQVAGGRAAVAQSCSGQAVSVTA